MAKTGTEDSGLYVTRRLMPTSETPVKPAPRVGITLITGFLGAGKSTLIRRVLTERHQLRIVVVENEFAENSAVEHAIVTQGVGPTALEEFIELPNGCICCAAQDDLTDSLQRLVHSKRGSFDHILIEASGVADPGPVAASLWVDEGLDSSLFLDSVVTIVDAVNLNEWLSHQDAELVDLAHKQLVVADLVLLNKVDLLDSQSPTTRFTRLSETELDSSSGASRARKISDVTNMIRDHGCAAEIIPTTQCDVELSRLLNIRAYDEDSTLRTLRTASRPVESLRPGHAHVSSVGSVTLTFADSSFLPNKLDRVLGEILWNVEEDEQPDGASCEVWRMKALATVSGEMSKRVYQSVHTLFDSTPSTVPVGDDMTSSFVFIGARLDRATLRQKLAAALIN